QNRAPENERRATPNYPLAPQAPSGNPPEERLPDPQKPKIVVQVALPLLVPIREESIEVRRRLVVEVLQVVVRLQ
ncbi:unnamed protein product, partial [Prunus brigantina]